MDCRRHRLRCLCLAVRWCSLAQTSFRSNHGFACLVVSRSARECTPCTSAEVFAGLGPSAGFEPGRRQCTGEGRAKPKPKSPVSSGSLCGLQNWKRELQALWFSWLLRVSLDQFRGNQETEPFLFSIT